MKKIEIVPSLLSADFACLADEIAKVEKAGSNRLHLDVMDGHFVPNISIGPVVIKGIRKRTKLYFQTHLMIDDPERYIKDFKDAGSDCIIIHQEIKGDYKKIIKDIKNLGIDAGISIRPKTPVESIKGVIEDVDMVLIMSVEPGFGGQPYIEGSDKKIEETKFLINEKGLNIAIGVDGGVSTTTAALVAKAGATHLIAGNAAFSGDVEKNIRALNKAAGV